MNKMNKEKVVDKIKETPKEKLKVLHEWMFWEDDDPRLGLVHRDDGGSTGGVDLQYVDLEHDAYIWLFAGSRGAGKTQSMTYYACKANYLYGTRIVSNYQIEYILRFMDGTTRHVKSEPLDLYKLLMFDEDYRHCLILIDEAPDIISHMASMTWKNRLLNIFVRQIRKNMNSLMLGAQQLSLIDKSMRWQTDIIVRCKDSFRLYGGSEGLCRGSNILLDMFDNSGQWTGHGKGVSYDSELDMYTPDDSLELMGVYLWGDDEHKSVFDTYFTQDVFESLKRVDMKLGSYQVGEQKDLSYLDRSVPYIQQAKDMAKVERVGFYASIGDLSDAEKRDLGIRLRQAGVKDCGHGADSMTFKNFDMDKFMRGAVR